MAHGITNTDQMFSVREVPWHGLGHILGDNPTREEAQRLVHGWEPVETPVYRRVPVIAEDGTLSHEFEQIEGFKALERSDDGANLSIVNETRGTVTHHDMWDVAEAVGKIGEDVVIETAGTLNGGRNTWILLAFKEPLQIVGDPNGATVARFALQNSHDATSAFRGQGINTRIVCQNTSFSADAEAARSGMEFVFRNTKNVRDRIEEAQSTLAAWREGTVAWKHTMDHLVTEKVTPAQREMFVQKFIPLPSVPDSQITDRVRGNVEKARQQVRGIFDSQTQEGIGLTTFGLFQAGVEWSQHFRAVKGADERSRMESYFRRHIQRDGGLKQAILATAREAAHA